MTRKERVMYTRKIIDTFYDLYWRFPSFIEYYACGGDGSPQYLCTIRKKFYKDLDLGRISYRIYNPRTGEEYIGTRKAIGEALGLDYSPVLDTYVGKLYKECYLVERLVVDCDKVMRLVNGNN